MHRAANDIEISELFTKRSNHRNTTIILLLQNLFPKSKYMTDIKRNATYIFLMSNPSDENSIRVFSQQFDPQNPQFLYSAFIDATKNKPFSYLLVDMHQQQAKELRVRSNLGINVSADIFVYIKIQEYIELCKRIGLIGKNKKSSETKTIDYSF